MVVGRCIDHMHFCSQHHAYHIDNDLYNVPWMFDLRVVIL
jgi:hypothetical protein